MKLLVLAFLLCFGAEALAQYDAKFKAVLAIWDSEDRRSLDKTNRDAILARWPGIRTMDGVRANVRELLNVNGSPNRGSAVRILLRSEVPREEIVSYLLESAAADRSNLPLLSAYFFLFTLYPEDERLLTFLATLLDDKSDPSVGLKRLSQDEEVGGDTWRVCDGAHGTIIQILEKRGEINPSDPGYGDPGGEMTIEGRAKNIAAIKLVLSKAGYVGVAQPGLASAKRARPVPIPGRATEPTLTSQVPAQDAGPQNSAMTPRAALSAWQALLAAILTSAVVFGIAVGIKRRCRRQKESR